jgi:hypothetical protein
MVSAVERRQATALRVVLAGGLAADLFFTDASHWGTTLVRATGNAAHLDLLGPIPEDATTEEAVYASRELPWIPPELRRGDEEFERWAEIRAMQRVDEILRRHEGSSPVELEIPAAGGRWRVLRSRTLRVEWSPQLQSELLSVLGVARASLQAPELERIASCAAMLSSRGFVLSASPGRALCSNS